MSFCAIDFGTSNSAIAIPGEGAVRSPSGAGMTLVELEPGHRPIPTAVFYFAETGDKPFARAALDAYVDGHEGRLMRSMKSLLCSHLIAPTTEIGGGLT